MMDTLEHDIDILKQRITEQEQVIDDVNSNIITLSYQIKELQHFLVKMAKNQSDLAKNVSRWPYVVIKPVPNKKDS